MDDLLAALALADFSYRGNRPPTEWMSTMSVATARVELYSLPGSTGSVITDYAFVKRHLTEPNFRSYLATDMFPESQTGVGSAVWDVRSIWNEAHVTNDHVNAVIENNNRELSFDRFDAAINHVRLVSVEPDRKAQADAMAVLRRREAQQAEMIKNLERRIELLSADITDGADTRLIPFWDKASENADEAGFCPEYDRMAEMMNGVRRSKTYTVRMSRTVTYTEYATIEVSIPSDPNGTSSRELMRAINDQELLTGDEDWEGDSDMSYGDEEVDDYDLN
jgi:hypothetical protein